MDCTRKVLAFNARHTECVDSQTALLHFPSIVHLVVFVNDIHFVLFVGNFIHHDIIISTTFHLQENEGSYMMYN